MDLKAFNGETVCPFSTEEWNTTLLRSLGYLRSEFILDYYAQNVFS